MNRVLKIILVVIIISSCRSGTQPYRSYLSGSPGEVLVVMPEYYWSGIPGKACREVFGAPYEMLPQYEPVFDMVQISPDPFNDFFRLHTNALIAEISPEIKRKRKKSGEIKREASRFKRNR